MLQALKQNWLFVFFIIFLTGLSFCIYAPCFFPLYDSDHAIQTLMSVDFTWPRDAFYWGQNRLGSLLPLLTYPFVKLFGLHPLYVISVLHYALLFASLTIISRYIKSKWLIAILFVTVFFPVSNYRAILFIGHPYSVQLFCGVLFTYFCHIFYLHLLQATDSSTTKKNYLYLFGSLTLALLFYCLGIWTSELSAILILIPLLYFIYDFKTAFAIFKVGLAYFYIVFIITVLIFFYISLSTLKTPFPADELYDKAFFFTPQKIALQFKYMWITISNTLLFKDKYFMDNLFYFITLPFVLLLLLTKSKGTFVLKNKQFYFSLILTALITSVFLFFSNWNLRSNFCPRYFIPVYYLLILAFLFYLDRKFSDWRPKAFAIIFMLYCTVYSYSYYQTIKGPGAVSRFCDFKNLPQGTLITSYWDAYVIGSVATKNLTVFPYEDEFVRNWFAIKKGCVNKNFYFLNNNDINRFIKNDTLRQFGHSFVPSGEKYNCNGLEVLRYIKVN